MTIPALTAFQSLPRFRWTSRTQFFCSCPVHKEKTGSMRGTIAGGKLLLHCFGCHAGAKAILDALGLPWSSLYADGKGLSWEERRRLNTERLEREKFDSWRERELMKSAAELRERDAVLHLDWKQYKGPLMWDALEHVCRGYGALEHRFETLRSGTADECKALQNSA